MFFSVSGKFAPDARKAFFGELSMRLEMMAEAMTLETKAEEFDELLAIVNALKIQAVAHQADRICEEMAAKRAAQQAKNEVKF